MCGIALILAGITAYTAFTAIQQRWERESRNFFLRLAIQITGVSSE